MTIILTHQQIQHKIKRIAYQIFEANMHETEFILAGIEGNGYTFAEKLYHELTQICTINIQLCRVWVNKKNVLEPIKTSLTPEEYQQKSIVLVDDVLNSGATLIYGVKHFLDVPLKNFKTAVLVNRNHKNYPVKADFKGISLSTSLKERIEVSFENENKVFLV